MKTSKKWSLTIAMIAMGLVMVISFGRDSLILRKDAIDVMEADPSSLKAGDHVQVDISLVWDEVISVTETTKTYGITTSSWEGSRYYALPYLYYATIDGKEIPTAYASDFILVKISSSYFDTMERAFDKTNDWYDEWWAAFYDYSDFPQMPGTVLSFEGKLSNLTKEDMKYALEYLEWLEYEPDEDHATLEDYFVPYYIQPIMRPTAAYVGALIGLGLLIAGVVLLILAIRSSREDKAMAAAVASSRVQNNAYYQPGAETVTFNNDIAPQTGVNAPYGQYNSQSSNPGYSQGYSQGGYQSYNQGSDTNPDQS